MVVWLWVLGIISFAICSLAALLSMRDFSAFIIFFASGVGSLTAFGWMAEMLKNSDASTRLLNTIADRIPIIGKHEGAGLEPAVFAAPERRPGKPPPEAPPISSDSIMDGDAPTAGQLVREALERRNKA
ncbi:hypothetical protein [Azospirillum sp.]|uniref:hypothetical protein n=1 Tax=Azospirillum sp. TaxID=34012 RepID=UPI003D706E4F